MSQVSKAFQAELESVYVNALNDWEKLLSEWRALNVIDSNSNSWVNLGSSWILVEETTSLVQASSMMALAPKEPGAVGLAFITKDLTVLLYAAEKRDQADRQAASWNEEHPKIPVKVMALEAALLLKIEGIKAMGAEIAAMAVAS